VTRPDRREAPEGAVFMAGSLPLLSLAIGVQVPMYQEGATSGKI